jgi:hypothetical protein
LIEVERQYTSSKGGLGAKIYGGRLREGSKLTRRRLRLLLPSHLKDYSLLHFQRFHSALDRRIERRVMAVRKQAVIRVFRSFTIS